MHSKSDHTKVNKRQEDGTNSQTDARNNWLYQYKEIYIYIYYNLPIYKWLNLETLKTHGY